MYVCWWKKWSSQVWNFIIVKLKLDAHQVRWLLGLNIVLPKPTLMNHHHLNLIIYLFQAYHSTLANSTLTILFMIFSIFLIINMWYCQKFGNPSHCSRFDIICNISNKFIHKIKVAIMSTTIFFQGSGDKFYQDMDYRIGPKISTKAHAKSAYKWNTNNSWHLAFGFYIWIN